MTAGQPDLLRELFGGLAFLVVASALVAVPVSFATLWVYRRRIIRSLESDTISRGDAGADIPDTESPVQGAAQSTVREDPSQETAGVRRELRPDLVTDAFQHRRNLARLYSFGGLGLALAFAASHGLISNRFWQVIVPCGLAVGLNWLVLYGRWRPGPWFVVLLILGLSVLEESALLFLTVVVILLGLLLHPRLRAMAPMALAFFSLVSTGTVAAIFTAIYVYRHSILADVFADPRLKQFLDLREKLNSDAISLEQFWRELQAMDAGVFSSFLWDHFFSVLRTIAGISLLGLLVSLTLGILVFVLVAKRYGRKQTSSQWLVILSSWLVLAIASSNPEWPLSLATNLAAVAVFAIVVRVGWKRLRRTEQPGVRMLLLRSFTLGRRSDWFFQELETLWRGIGSVQLIGGPDLALSTLEPHELLDFLRRRAGRYFVHTQADVDRRIGGFDYERDPDGCFRVNDLYCADAVWQYAATRLLNSSDCVVLDLRGFNRHRAGCVFEIQCLAQSMPPSRVVFLADKITDRSFVKETWLRAAAPASVEAAPGGMNLQFVSDEPGAGDICGRVITALSGAAASPPQVASAPAL